MGGREKRPTAMWQSSRWHVCHCLLGPRALFTRVDATIRRLTKGCFGRRCLKVSECASAHPKLSACAPPAR
eukprot:5294245-Alexandrium_andersonii.AAC.1